MSAVKSASVDAIYSSHNIEHLYPHDIPLALAEFLRVLKPNGFAVITCPDLQSVAALVAQDKLTEPAYVSPAGPVAPIDMLYGFRGPMAQGNLFMAHHSGFTRRVLHGTLEAAGFRTVATLAHPEAFALWALAAKANLDELELRTLAAKYFP
jgi:SAM-dependent methyltransferase